jgi:hypothetical protein
MHMAVSIDTSSVKIALDDTVEGNKHAKAGVELHPREALVVGGRSFPGYIYCQCTRKKRNVDYTTPFFATGTVKFLLGPGDTLDNWKVGFLQLDMKPLMRAQYAGRMPAEGGIVLDATLSQDWPGGSHVALDCMKMSPVPWYAPPATSSIFKGPVATVVMGDSPAAAVPLTLGNGKVSHTDNYLLEFKSWQSFWTILTAMEPDGTPHYLAHFVWSLQWSVGLQWAKGAPRIASDDSKFVLDKTIVTGPPTRSEVAPLLAKPTGPVANDAFIKPWDNAILATEATTHVEWDNTDQLVVPHDFWN